MCLQVNAKKQYPQVAEEDITVYKYLRIRNNDGVESLEAPFRGFCYTVGEEYSAELGAHLYNQYNPEEGCFVEEGFHSIKTYKSLEGYVENLHEVYLNYRKYAIVECVIPKGSTYYEGTWTFMEGYASDKIKIVSVLKEYRDGKAPIIVDSGES